MNKLKNILLLPLSLVALATTPTILAVGSIETQDTSPASEREQQVGTTEGLLVHSQTINAWVGAVSYSNVKASVYLTDSIYLYKNGAVNEVGQDSSALAFYVELDFTEAYRTSGGQQYVYTAEDENYFRVNLYASAYNQYSAENDTNYQEDILYADFMAPTDTDNPVFQSYQILVPKIEMAWSLELLNDSDATIPIGASSDIKYEKDSSTKSLMYEDFLISDYAPSVYSLSNYDYPSRYYDYENDAFMFMPYIDKVNPTYSASTNTLTIDYEVHFDYSGTTYGMSAPSYFNGTYNRNYISGWLEIPTTDTTSTYYIDVQTTDRLVTGFDNESTTVVLNYDWSSYILYYEGSLTFDFSNTSTKYSEEMYKTNTNSESDNSIYIDDVFATTTDLYTLSGVTTDNEFDSKFNWEKAQAHLYLNFTISYSIFDGQYWKQYNWTEFDSEINSTQGSINNNYVPLYSKSLIYDSLNTTSSIDNSGDVGSTVIGWLFIGLTISSIIGLAIFYSYYSRKKIDTNIEEFEKLNEELKKGAKNE